MKRNPLFKYCSKKWHPVIENNQRILKVSKRGVIFSEGDPVKGIYFIIDGKIKVISRYNKNSERIHRIGKEGTLLGHRGFSAKNYPVSAIALEDTVVAFIPNAIFIQLIKANPELSIYLINFLTEELRETEKRIKNTLQLEVKHRIAHILLDLARSFGYESKDSGKLNYTLSRKEMASMAGTTYETVVRTLLHLKNENLIKLVGKSIHIKDVKKLEKLAAMQN